VIGLSVATVNMTPDANGLPGGPVIQQLTNGIGQWALIASLVALVIGAAMWALGHYSQNYPGRFADLPVCSENRS
jgi:hypothetical protein